MKKFFTLVACALCAVGANAQEVNYTYDVPAGTEAIDQVLIDQVAEQAKADAGDEATSYSATINIPAGTYNVSGVSEEGGPAGITLPEGFSVNIVGEDGTVLTFPKSLNIGGTHDFIRFENVEIADGGCEYLINQDSDTKLGELLITDSYIHDFKSSLIRTKGGIVQIDNIIVENSILTNMAAGNGYSVFYFKASQDIIGKLELKNSTFNTSQRSFIEASTSPIANGIVITNCTFYNNVASGKYLIDNNAMVTDITISNTIIGKSYDTGAKGIRTGGTLDVSTNNFRTADCIYAGNDIKELVADERASADIFTDPENGDFTLTIDNKVGAPRWYKAGAGDDTSVNGVTVNAANSDAPAYNLAGQKVNDTFKGVVVKNGKKIVRK